MPDTPPVVDAFCRVGPFVTRQAGQPYTMEDLLAEHARFGIRQRLCIHVESINGRCEEGNAAMTKLAHSAPGTGVIWMALPPHRFDAPPIDDTLAAAQREGVAMFTMAPQRHQHTLEVWANAELYAAMERARLPLLLDGEMVEGRCIHEIAAAFPRLPLVLWNFMYSHERKLVALMDLHANIHLCPAPRFVVADVIEKFTRRYGPGRLIYGSSWPLVDYAQATQSPGPLLAMVMYARVSDQTKADILGGNLLQLLGGVRWKVAGLTPHSGAKP